MIELNYYFDTKYQSKVIRISCQDSEKLSKFLLNFPGISQFRYERSDNHVVLNKAYFQTLYYIFKNEEIDLADLDKTDLMFPMKMKSSIESFIVNNFPEEYTYFLESTKEKIIKSLIDKNLKLTLDKDQLQNTVQQQFSQIQILQNQVSQIGKNNQFFNQNINQQQTSNNYGNF